MVGNINVENIDGYRVVTHVPGDVAETLRHYRLHDCNGVNFLSWHELTSDEIAQLSMFEGLRSINIQCDIKFSLEGLEGVQALENLSFAKTKGSLDVAKMPGLKRLALDWHPGVVVNTNLSSITSLRVFKYRHQSGDLSYFPVFPKLEDLMLIDATLESIKGMSRNGSVKKLSLYNCKKLHDLSLIGLPDLQSLLLEGCSNLNDLAALGSCEGLKEVFLHDCSQVDSIQFAKKLFSLKSFRFIGTVISDGDISPLLGVHDVFFRDSPRYNLALKDFQQQGE